MRFFLRLFNGLIVIILAFSLAAGCSSGQGSTAVDDFPDYETLAGWVENHSQPFERGSGVEAWYQAALIIQREAARDNYLVSVTLIESPYTTGEYLVRCSAQAGGDLYWWFPEDQIPHLLFTAEQLTP